jgi:hypothetical protein
MYSTHLHPSPIGEQFLKPIFQSFQNGDPIKKRVPVAFSDSSVLPRNLAVGNINAPPPPPHLALIHRDSFILIQSLPPLLPLLIFVSPKLSLHISGAIFKKLWEKGSALPEVELRFCPWLLLFEYWTGRPEPSSSLCIHYIYLW